MRNIYQPQQFDKSQRVVWSESLQKYVIDYMPILKIRDLTPEQIKKENQMAERRAERF